MNHREKTIADIEQRLARMASGVVTQDDVELMLIHLRHYAQDSMFEELAHFVAHPERYKGKFFDHMRPIVKDMVDAFKSRGKFNLNPIMTYTDVMDELIATLNKINIHFDESRIRLQAGPIVHSIMDAINLTQIDVKKLCSPDVKAAVFEKSNQGKGIKDYYLWLCLSFDDNPTWTVKTYANVKVGIPVISPDIT